MQFIPPHIKNQNCRNLQHILKLLFLIKLTLKKPKELKAFQYLGQEFA